MQNEATAWQQAQRLNNADGYRLYLQSWPPTGSADALLLKELHAEFSERDQHAWTKAKKPIELPSANGVRMGVRSKIRQHTRLQLG
ncbi:hypothetical protein A9Q89_03730 [Gammaproteobacteria bacterium 53_120_T64]|nr:hypothetical protein A9Q89_03730 [Gammaproteobacteria bacterium 53_120_T64]